MRPALWRRTLPGAGALRSSPVCGSMWIIMVDTPSGTAAGFSAGGRGAPADILVSGPLHIPPQEKGWKLWRRVIKLKRGHSRARSVACVDNGVRGALPLSRVAGSILEGLAVP
jgi:hypothetical protein